MLSRRLRAVLGADLENIAEHHLHALVDAGVAEDQDLDFKETWYDRGNKGSFELSKDVAAFANQVGGLIIIGMKEARGVAAGLSPVKAETDHELRIRQVLASRVFPIVQGVRVREVRGTAGRDDAYYLVEIPRSVDSPHGVVAELSDRRPMCWPLRNGTSTRYLYEAELAARYRDRFAFLQKQSDRLAELHREGGGRREPGQIVTLVLDVGLLPSLPGDRPLTGESSISSFLEVDRWPFSRLRLGDLRQAKLLPRRRRLRVETSSHRFELHTDGAGWARAFIGSPIAGAHSIRVDLVRFEQVVHGLVGLLGEFACWTGATGDCMLSAHVGRATGSVVIVDPTGTLLAENIGVDIAPAEITLPVDGLAEPAGAEQAAFLVARDLEQDLGVLEPLTLGSHAQS
jgi:hypothetical protein